MAAMAKVDRAPGLAWTDDGEAQKLLVDNPLALLIGFLLDQQVPMEWAFGAPYLLRQRLGGRLDPAEIAGMDPARLERAFTEKPPLHRYPNSMARRTQTLCRVIVDEYGGDPGKIWNGATAQEAARRIARLPGFSANKASVIIGVLGKQLGLKLEGWEQMSPSWFSLADVDSKEALEHYRGIKRAAKQAGKWPPV